MTHKPQLTVCCTSKRQGPCLWHCFPRITPASPCSGLVQLEGTPKTQLWQTDFSPCPTHRLFLPTLQQLGMLQGSPLLPPSPTPCCRLGPLEEKISNYLLPTCSFAMSSKLAPLPLSWRRWYSMLSLDMNSLLKWLWELAGANWRTSPPSPDTGLILKWEIFTSSASEILKVFQLFFFFFKNKTGKWVVYFFSMFLPALFAFFNE